MAANPSEKKSAADQAVEDQLGMTNWWGIATFFRCAIETDPDKADIALVGVPHFSGNGMRATLSITPNGTLQLISPLSISTATSEPQGGLVQGMNIGLNNTRCLSA